MTDSVTVPCIKCGTSVTLTQKGGGEFAPSGKCPKCGMFHYVSFDSAGEMRVNASQVELAE
jgi:predicted nucleic-acid-binding Zn-ribbon protein